jgi:hypothetical protein
LDITPLEEYSVPRKRACANFSAVDQRLDMERVYWVVAVLTNQRYRFCGGHPVVVHGGISLSQRNIRVCFRSAGWLMVRWQSDTRRMSIGALQDQSLP